MRAPLVALALLVLAPATARADPEFDPTTAERKTIADCLEQSGSDELKAMRANASG